MERCMVALFVSRLFGVDMPRLLYWGTIVRFSDRKVEVISWLVYGYAAVRASYHSGPVTAFERSKRRGQLMISKAAAAPYVYVLCLLFSIILSCLPLPVSMLSSSRSSWLNGTNTHL